MNQADKVRSLNRYNVKQVMFLTSVTEEEYCNFQIDTAKAWVDRYWSKDLDADLLMNTNIFWRWWMNCWYDIDTNSIIPRLYHIKREKCLRYYRAMHQYVFDEQSTNARFLMDDFKGQLSIFRAEMKKLKKP